jgi:hypothetical protein
MRARPYTERRAALLSLLASLPANTPIQAVSATTDRDTALTWYNTLHNKHRAGGEYRYGLGEGDGDGPVHPSSLRRCQWQRAPASSGSGPLWGLLGWWGSGLSWRSVMPRPLWSFGLVTIPVKLMSGHRGPLGPFPPDAEVHEMPKKTATARKTAKKTPAKKSAKKTAAAKKAARRQRGGVAGHDVVDGAVGSDLGG